MEIAQGLADASGGSVVLTDDPFDAVHGADFVHTDVWVSMGEAKEVWADRISQLQPYQVNIDLMKATGLPRRSSCTASRHSTTGRPTVGQQIYDQFGLDGLEVTEDVFESPASIVFDQAENRMHTIKAVMVATLGS